MIVLVVILFASQGVLCEVYDVKCLLDRETAGVNKGNCVQGGLNPFYSSRLYWELGTKTYWTETMKDKTAEADFLPDAWWRF